MSDLFDGVVISGNVGIRKPAPEIYEMGARAVHLDPADCVYVDDLPGNLKPARALGMTTVHHRDAATTIAELSSLLKITLDRLNFRVSQAVPARVDVTSTRTNSLITGTV